MVERALVFPCEQSRLVGILTPGVRVRGVVVVVGGPQYRVGSHRQFVELARALSARGTPVLRFDYRGLGDSEGELRGFEYINADIRAAIDALMSHQPCVQEVVLWGLCDAASASLMYAPTDSRVCGVAMLNPWARSTQSQARTWLRHYYLRRLLSREFWRNVTSGGLDFAESLRSLRAHVHAALFPANVSTVNNQSAVAPRWQGGPLPTLPDLMARMANAMASFQGRVLIITSGEDLTAAEFNDVSDASPVWRRLLMSDRVTMRQLLAANHTFSRATWKTQVESWTTEWIETQ